MIERIKPTADADGDECNDVRPAVQGDFRGPYGYGRRAHGSDPLASYAFNRNPRTLPPPGAPTTPPPALEQRPVASAEDDIVMDQTVFRE